MKHTSFRWVSLAVATISLLALPASAERPSTTGNSKGPQSAIEGIRRGQAAIASLGARLPEVARKYGTDAQTLVLRLRYDANLAVDPAGGLLYTCEGPMAAGGATGGGATGPEAAPLADTFLLHSRPGATKVLYLDFDGHVTSGTIWNQYFSGGADIVTPPYDQDGNTASFSNSELQSIQSIWQRVAEDFAPFDVDVTTEDPGVEALRKSSGGDSQFGGRVCIGGSSYDWYGAGAGGVAYVGSFSWNSDTPSFVFEAQLGNGDSKYTAEATSHEAGHMLGLSHDGTTTGSSYYQGHGSGATGWAPIMGVGYYQPVVQWSRGEYANANNTEDDLAIIASYVGYRNDDHGDSAASATYVPIGGSFTSAGIIGQGTDVDVFAFSTRAGQVTLTVAPDNFSPNLDVLMELRDGSNALLASVNPAGALDASLTTSLPEGTYFVHIKGVGYGNPLNTGYSDYASKGTYVLQGTVIDPTGQTPPVAVISATPTSGEGPLVVSLSGTGSFDPDGVITSYDWDFGDGTTGSGAQVSKTYVGVGTYVARLTVTDDSGLTASTTTSIEVLGPNILPTAVISTSTSGGNAPLAVNFNGGGSSDPDGSISSYSWDFGDGSTGSGASVSKTYNTPGTYVASLTVTDNRGGTDSTTTTIVVSANPALTIRVASIVLKVSNSSRGKTVSATVQITDLSGATVSNANVTGTWSGAVSGNSSGRTSKNGSATLTSPRFKGSGAVTFTVTGVSKSGLFYDEGQNAMTSVSISAATTP